MSTAIAPASGRNGVRATAASATGTVLEWYAYGNYGTASALFIAPLFFSASDPTVGVLLAFATFAAGFLIRPIGAIILGPFGDRHGRKTMLILTISLMAGATFLIGCLPTYAQIGVLAPVLLVALRLLEGFGAGAELAGAMTFSNETAPQRKRAFYTSFMGAGVYTGILLSTGTFAILNAVLSKEAMLAWGWRVPFLLSAIIVVIPVVLRAHVEESEDFKKVAKKTELHRQSPVVQLFREQKLGVLAGFLSQGVVGFCSFVSSAFMLSYLTNTLKLPAQHGLSVILIGGPIAVVGVLLFGLLSDRIGAVKVLKAAAILSALFAFPFFMLLNTGNLALNVLAFALGYTFTFSMTSAAQGVFLPGLFEPQYRLTGVSFSREFANGLIGGPASLIASALVLAANGQTWMVSGAMIVFCIIAFIGIVLGARILRQRKEWTVLRGLKEADAQAAASMEASVEK